MNLDKDKLKTIYRCMNEQGVDAWLIVGRETAMNSEPILPVLGDMDFIIHTGLMFTADGKLHAVVSPLDIQGYLVMDGVDEVIEYVTMEQGLTDLIKKLQPKNIALDYSDDPASDGLTYGQYRMLERAFANAGFTGEVLSAEKLVNKVRGMKPKPQIAKIEHATVEALKIFEAAASFIKKGTTSTDIFHFFQQTAFDKGYGMSWADSQCPGGFVGPEAPRGHMAPPTIEVGKGMLINVDYGVRIDGYVSDNQRMYYVLKDGEDDAPAEVKKYFEQEKHAIRLALAAMKPGVTGFEVDKICRDYLVEECGHPTFTHATGHMVGHECHDGGAILAPRFPRYDRPELIDTPLEVGNVFTIEPSFPTPYGVMAMEEMVVIGEDGVCRFLGAPQEELYLIRI